MYYKNDEVCNGTSNNKANEYDKKKMLQNYLTGRNKTLTEQEQDERIALLHEINELENKLDIDHDDVLKRLKVESLNQLTNKQLVECINNLKKVQK